MEPIIEIQQLVKTYKLYDKPADRLKEALSITKKKYHREFSALNGITFSVEKGDALGILGKNGSGKSTLLKMITGVLSPTSGKIQANGKIAAILELGAGFNPEYTGRENIYLNGLMMGYSREEMDPRITAIIEFADIGTFIDQPVKLYSSGMFARLAFAVSINVDPDILIVDEALAVGDMRFQTKCIDKMKELKSKGTTILFVSHAAEQVKRFCNKAVWIKDGVIEVIGEASEVVDQYEDFMRYGEISSRVTLEDKEEEEFVLPTNPDTLASIKTVSINKEKFETFDQVVVDVIYDVYETEINGLLLGIAIYTPDRKYIFGPNTDLEEVRIPIQKGRHKIRYTIPKLPLLGGTYCFDIGLFNNKGIVSLDYKQDAAQFTVTNKYFSEGMLYIQHNWDVVK
ncbi:ABC transporter ATP-binding protein [Paenibacillus amylolyticus]|uniref:ABC transporter ATP-binding protein n=1 Tax=Paenibacillus amylolyticus TaxID=1451 RepID=UPI003879F5EC